MSEPVPQFNPLPRPQALGGMSRRSAASDGGPQPPIVTDEAESESSSVSNWVAAGSWDNPENVCARGEQLQKKAEEALGAMVGEWQNLREARREAVKQAKELVDRMVLDAQPRQQARKEDCVPRSSIRSPQPSWQLDRRASAGSRPQAQQVARGRRRGEEREVRTWECTLKRGGIKSVLDPKAEVKVRNGDLTVEWSSLGLDSLNGKKSLKLTPHVLIGAEKVDHRKLRVHYMDPPKQPTPESEAEHHHIELVDVRANPERIASDSTLNRPAAGDRGAAIDECRAAIQGVANLLRPLRERRHRRLLVIVNPVSGHRLGEAHFQQVQPLLDVGLDTQGWAAENTEDESRPKRGPYETFRTKYAGHAADRVKKMDLDAEEIGGIVCIGGDGTCSEVINAIYERADAGAFLERVTLGTIPAGSECALAKMVSYLHPLAAAYTILKGHTEQRLDLLRVEQQAATPAERRVVYSVCGLGWGIAGKLAEESEAMRSVFGPARYLVSGIKSFVNLRGVPGTITLEVPEMLADEPAEGPRECPFGRRCEVCEKGAARRGAGWAAKTKTWELPGPFTLVAMLKSEKTLAPHVHLSDGLMDVIWVGDINHFNLVKASSRIITRSHLADKDGGTDKESFRYAKARSVRLRPENSSDKINVDGEVLDGLETDVRVEPAALCMFVARAHEAQGARAHEAQGAAGAAAQ